MPLSDNLNAQIQYTQSKIVQFSNDLNDLKLQTDQLNAQKSKLMDNLITNSTALKKIKEETQNYMIKNEHYRKEINSLLKTVTQSNVND